MTQADPTTERRRVARKRTLKGAKVVYGDFRFTQDCVVRDATEIGARLKCGQVSEVPDSFYLFDTNEHWLRPAEVRWRNDREIGVAFVGERINIYDSTDPRLARFRHL